MILPNPHQRFAAVTLVLMVWLGYLGWLVACRRPEPLLPTSIYTSWPSRAWLASTQVIVEVETTGAAMKILKVYQDPTRSWQLGQELPAALRSAIEESLERIALDQPRPSSWIIGLQASHLPEGKTEWILAADPAVPGRNQGAPRLIPATPWTRAWLPTGS